MTACPPARRVRALLIALLLPIAAGAAELDRSRPGSREVASADAEVTDADRGRRLPLRLYVPAGTDRVPLVLFSHGLGGSREGGRAWGEHWASHGYLVLHVQHPGSDESVMREAMKGKGRDGLKDAMSPRAFADRVHDVRFLLDLVAREPTRIHRDAARADAKRIGMSGHSYGSRTTLALAGERVPFSAGEFADTRIVAAIAFSPYAPPPADAWPKRFGAVRIPVLSVTGTQDRDLILGNEPAVRREPFRHMAAGDKYLLVLQGADHAVFGGQAGFRGGLSRSEVIMYDRVRAFTLAFWDAYLKGDAGAKAWLAGGEAAAALKAGGEFLAR